MTKYKQSVTSIVSEIIENDPAILRCLQRGVLNLSQTARWLMDEHELDNVSDSAVTKALDRYRERMLSDNMHSFFSRYYSVDDMNEYARIISLRGNLTFRTIATTMAYFHESAEVLKMDDLKRVNKEVMGREYRESLFTSITDDMQTEGLITRRGKNGKIIVPAEPILENVKKSDLYDLDIILDENNFVHPRLDKLFTGHNKMKDIRKSFDELLYVSSKLEGPVYQTGLLFTAMGTGWKTDLELKDSTDDITGIEKPIVLVRGYLDNLSEKGLTESRGAWRYIQYRSFPRADNLIRSSESLEDIIRHIDPSVLS